MRYLSRNQWLLLITFLISIGMLLTFTSNSERFSSKEIANYLESLEFGFFENEKKMTEEEIKEAERVSARISSHRFEEQVKSLLKAKLNEELKYAREKLQHDKEKMESELEKFKTQKAEIEKLNPIPVNYYYRYTSKDPEYAINEYSYTSSEIDSKKAVDPNLNENIIFSILSNDFGRGRSYKDFLALIANIKGMNPSKTTVALTIGNGDLLKSIKQFVKEYFEKLSTVPDEKLQKNYFSKIIIVEDPFLEKKIQVNRGDRQDEKLQPQRRKVLAEMRNFLLAHGLTNEKYALFLDSDMIRLPDDFWNLLIDSNKDIATFRVDMMNKGVAVHPDYDQNAWTGTRAKPTKEEEEKIDNDSDFFFIPKSTKDTKHFLEISESLEDYGLDKSPSAALELQSVGGAILFAKTAVFKQGVTFPPYYVIGTTWERTEGWDGIETEGLCYQANSMGYKCWGFPNIVAYHSF